MTPVINQNYIRALKEMLYQKFQYIKALQLLYHSSEELQLPHHSSEKLQISHHNFRSSLL